MELPSFEAFRAAFRTHGFREAESRRDEVAFGSWWIVLDDPPARVMWDGKERSLVVQQRSEDDWTDAWLACDEDDHAVGAVAEQLTLLRRHS